MLPRVKPRTNELSYSLLLDTPRDFSCLFLDKWISPKDVVHLDSALCAHSCRSDFLELLKASEFVMSSTKSNPLRTFGLFCDWIMKRQVKLSHLELGQGSNPVLMSKIESFLQYCAPSLKSIVIVALRINMMTDDGYDPIFHIIENYCHRLESISVQAGHLPLVFGTILSNNANSIRSLDIVSNKWSLDFIQNVTFPELTTLTLGKAGDLKPINSVGVKSLEYFATRAPRLRVVSLQKFYVEKAGLTALEAHCKELQEIILELGVANAQSIIDYCPRSVPIKLQCYEKIASVGLEVFKSGLTITALDLINTSLGCYTLNAICTSQATMTSLKLARCQLDGVPTYLFPTPGWPSLHSLNLSRCMFRPHLNVTDFLCLCTGISMLNLDGVEIDDSVLITIEQRLPQLEYLVLNTRDAYNKMKFTEIGLKRLVQEHPRLMSIVLFDAPSSVVNLLGAKLVKV